MARYTLKTDHLWTHVGTFDYPSVKHQKKSTVIVIIVIRFPKDIKYLTIEKIANNLAGFFSFSMAIFRHPQPPATDRGPPHGPTVRCGPRAPAWNSRRPEGSPQLGSGSSQAPRGSCTSTHGGSTTGPRFGPQVSLNKDPLPRPGKRLHNELERSTMLMGKIHYFYGDFQ